jgi:hypothetical protein
VKRGWIKVGATEWINPSTAVAAGWNHDFDCALVQLVGGTTVLADDYRAKVGEERADTVRRLVETICEFQ